MLRELLLRDYNDRDAGHRLYVIEETSNSGDEEEQDYETWLVEFELSTELGTVYDVFHLSLGIGDHELKLLRSFADDEAAAIYCEQQYTLFNGQPPMVEDGDGPNYHPKAKTVEVDIDDGMECDVRNGSDEEVDSDAYDYLVIINHETFEAYSLHPFCLWRPPQMF